MYRFVDMLEESSSIQLMILRKDDLFGLLSVLVFAVVKRTLLFFAFLSRMLPPYVHYPVSPPPSLSPPNGKALILTNSASAWDVNRQQTNKQPTKAYKQTKPKHHKRNSIVHCFYAAKSSLNWVFVLVLSNIWMENSPYFKVFSIFCLVNSMDHGSLFALEDIDNVQ